VRQGSVSYQLVRNEYYSSSSFFKGNYGWVDRKNDTLSLKEGELGEILDDQWREFNSNSFLK
jgi:hypothetical protein